jgi:hypothetical protein
VVINRFLALFLTRFCISRAFTWRSIGVPRLGSVKSKIATRRKQLFWANGVGAIKIVMTLTVIRISIEITNQLQTDGQACGLSEAQLINFSLKNSSFENVIDDESFQKQQVFTSYSDGQKVKRN